MTCTYTNVSLNIADDDCCATRCSVYWSGKRPIGCGYEFCWRCSALWSMCVISPRNHRSHCPYYYNYWRVVVLAIVLHVNRLRCLDLRLANLLANPLIPSNIGWQHSQQTYKRKSIEEETDGEQPAHVHAGIYVPRCICRYCQEEAEDCE